MLMEFGSLKIPGTHLTRARHARLPCPPDVHVKLTFWAWRGSLQEPRLVTSSQHRQHGHGAHRLPSRGAACCVLPRSRGKEVALEKGSRKGHSLSLCFTHFSVCAPCRHALQTDLHRPAPTCKRRSCREGQNVSGKIIEEGTSSPTPLCSATDYTLQECK